MQVRASERSHPAIGEVWPVAMVVNSRLTQSLGSTLPTYAGDIGRSGVPKRCGRTTVKPAATTSSANGDHLRREAGDLVDHDHAGAGALAVRRVGDAVGGVGRLRPAVEEGHARSMAATEPVLFVTWVTGKGNWWPVSAGHQLREARGGTHEQR